MHAFKQTAWVILSVVIISISLVAIIAIFNGIDVGKMIREHRIAEQTEQIVDFWERCSKQGHLCSEGVGTDGTRRTELSPWVEMKNDASNLTFGWADEVAVNATGRRDQSGLALQYYSGTGQDVPINRYDASK